MSREINLREKLSEEDKSYLLERGRNQAVEANDREFGDGAPSPERDPFGVIMSSQPTGDISTEAEMSGHHPTVVDKTRRPEPANPLVEVNAEGDIPPYSEWTVKALKTELKVRGLSTAGSNEELIQRLEDFDAAE